MADERDREIARRALDYQARARDYPLLQVPGYKAWSDRKLDGGESDALMLIWTPRRCVSCPKSSRR
jgi:hypothetical protein